MREWIVTNGLGGYASLTNNMTNTRKFHGLLVTSLNPPTERWVFVSNIFNTLLIKDKIYDLTKYKSKFSFDYFPTFTYDVEGVEIKKTVFMQHQKNTTIIKYDVKTNEPISITHNPIINSRHFYDVNHQRYLDFKTEFCNNAVYIKPSNIDKTLKIVVDDCTYEPVFYWEELFYQKDRERRDAWVDNNVHISKVKKNLKKSSIYYVILTIEEKIDIKPDKIFNQEVQRKKELFEKTDLDKKFKKLVLSTDNFIVKKGEGKSVIAGYHWFGDWGRDTLIALPGLTLVTKRYNYARQILESFSKYCQKGLIPNAFMDRDSKAVYNTVDASLWFIDRVFQYVKYTKDEEFLKNIWGILDSIVFGYKNGTDFGIHMDEDFLISHDPGLTWMDVKIGDYYPTPRSRKAVEIQALWYNALRIMSLFSQIIGKEDNYYHLSEKVKESFNKQFDQPYDVIDKEDISLRPNQLFLVSLDYNMIDEKMQKKIVEDAKNKLFTVVGMRTLSPNNPNYKGKYFGDYNKDIAYHNGTAWPWLIGPFVKAFLKVKKHGDVWREFSYKNFIKPLITLYGSTWDGSIHEIFDGDPIHEPRGCISQAWSVAEILRCWVEDIENIAPKYENIMRIY
jgi:predicted glycogen debranching enzyme